MVTSTEEYTSLRQELIEHQSRRLTILNVALPICFALFTVSIELQILFLPLFALIILHMTREQIAEAQYGVARIASYIRIILEADNPALNWESGSFWIRNEALHPKKSDGKKIWPIYPLAYIDRLLFWTGYIAIALSVGQSIFCLISTVTFPVYVLSVLNLITILPLTIFWMVIWVIQTRRFIHLSTLQADVEEGKKWADFKKKKIANKKVHTGNGTLGINKKVLPNR